MTAETTIPSSKPRRSVGRWILLGLTLMVTPVVIVAVGVLSMFRLNGDASALRREVVAATDADWDTKVQVSAGGIVIAAVRTGLLFVDDEDIADARLALAAVENASVGVYERNGRGGKWSSEQLLARTDERMRNRGLTRVVGVTGRNELVLVYASEDADRGDKMDLCIAVVDDDNLVIVSSKVDAGALMKLADRHMPEGGIKKQLKMAGL